MKIKILLTLLFISTYSFTQNKTFKNKEFHWTINIPEGCSIIKSKDWLKEKNQDNIKKGYDIETEEYSKIIVIIKYDSLNYFVAYRDTNLKKASSFINLSNSMKDVHATKLKVNGESVNRVMQIGKYEFKNSKFEYIFPDKSYKANEVFGAYMDGKVFSVFMQYSDKEKGIKLIESLKNSTFQ